MELTIEKILQRAIEAHKTGKLQEAEALYKTVLQVQPKNSDANHNLGILAISFNNLQASIPLFKTAVESNPNQGQFWISYLDALIKSHQLDRAKSVLEQGKKLGLNGEKIDALEKQLINNEAYCKDKQKEIDTLFLAIELRESGKYEDAQKLLTNYLNIQSSDAEAWSLLSQIYLLDKKVVEAEKALVNASSLKANLPSIYRNCARLLLKKSKPAEALTKAWSGYELSLNDPESWLVLASCLLANQKDEEALPLISRTLEARPNYAEALANRAMLHYRKKNFIDAIKDVELALSLKSHVTQLWAFLGTLQYQNNNVKGAIYALERAHDLDPYNLNYILDLGEFLRQDKRVSKAITVLEQAVKQLPQNANIWANLGLAFQQVARNEEAKTAYQKALAINPELAGIVCNLGTISKEAGDLHSARGYFEQAIAINPNFAGAYMNLGSALQNLGLLHDALLSYQKAISIKPDFAEAHVNLGNTLLELGKLQDALTSYQKAIAIKPDFAEAICNLGITFKELGKLEEAVTSQKTAIELKPDYAGAHNNLGLTLQDLGELDDALASYQKAIAIKPDFDLAQSNLLFCLNYHPDLSADAIFAEHRRWDQAHARHLLAQTTINYSRDPNRRLRIGYVSPNFNRHAAASFIHALLSNHDKIQFELFAYAQVSSEDEISKQLKSCVDHWQNTVGMSDYTLAERIQADGIDILVDLAGHTKGNRLLVFARKPAPIQVSWLGYGYTTGLQAMDYFLGDHHFTPIGSESLFSEKLLRLPVYAAYRPQTGMGDVGPLPALRNGGITFGSTSRSVRFNYRVIRAWAAILDRLPTSRLMINSASYRSEGMQARIRAKFAAYGVDPNRLIVGFESPPWGVLRQTDITLDCFPHNSGTTLFESLYMGVPFISLTARPSLGRIGATLLQGVGHPEWLAITEEDYIEKAILLATDLHKLAQLRGTLRSEMQASVLMNESAFALSVETAYREIWMNHCKAKDTH